MPGTFEDQAQLAQLFQQSLSPINTSGQNILALALQERQARDAAARQQEQSALLLSREQELEKIRQAGENERAKNANAAVLERLRQEYALKDKAQQETERRTMVEKANQVGANLPKDASFEDASSAYVQAHGKSYIEANKRMGVALSGVLRQTGQDPSTIASRVANIIADDPAVAKELSISEREQIRNNPGKLADFRKQFAAGKKAKYEAFVQAMNQASNTVTTELEKEAASKPEAVRAAAELRLAADNFKEVQKQGPVSPEIEATAFKVYSEAANPPPPPPPRQPNFGLPTARTAPAAAAVPPASSPFVAPETATPGGFITQGVTDAARAVVNKGPAFINSLIYPSTNAAPPAPQPPTDPSTLSNLRLRKFLQDSAATNSTLFPTAFPPYNTNQFTAPLSPSP